MTGKMMTAGTILLTASLAAGAAPIRGGMTPAVGDGDPLWEVADEYAAAMRAGNATAVAAVFADDAIEMPPGAPPARGRAAIEAYYGELFHNCRFTTFALSYSESRIAGDLGFLVGTSRVVVSNAAGPAASSHEDTGKYMVVLKRVGREWKVAYSIYKADDIPPAAAGSSR